MKNLICNIFLLLLVAFSATAQYKVTPNKPYSLLKSTPGFVMVNEITGGIGLNLTSNPDSKSFIGFTTILGYQLNNNFMAGAGTGVLFYDTNLLVPVFLDFRYFFMSGKFTPYIYGDGGLILKFSDLNQSKIFINPGAGVRYSLGRKIAVNGSIGILSQVDGSTRSSFVNFKGGMVYVF